MRSLNLSEIRSVSGGGARSYSNSFLAGMKGEDYNYFTGIDAMIGLGVGAVLGIPIGPPGMMIFGTIGYFAGAAMAANSYALGANYVQAMAIVGS